MIRPFSLANLHKQYENETPEERKARTEANRQRSLEWCAKWREFSEKYPEEAKKMRCAA